jgi:peptide/nickel transport system ATP-binding protein
VITSATSDRGGAAPDRLVVEGLRVVLTHSHADVVDEVSFTVEAGDMLGLVGESGSGKTTAALALLGYARRGLRIDGGSVRLRGIDVLQLSQRELRRQRGVRMAYVPQDPASALNPALRVGVQLREILRYHREDITGVSNPRARIEEVLDEVKLPQRRAILDAYPHQLSGGQQQRVALAMAFACRPALIVLDEPTTGLDVTTQQHVLETVRALCGTHGVAGVYVSHDLAVVAHLVSQVAVMYAGRVVELGDTATVFGEPAHPYTRALLRAVPSPLRAEVLQGIGGQPPRPGNRPSGCFFAARCPVSLPACLDGPPPVIASRPGHLVRCVRAAESGQRSVSARTLIALPGAGERPHPTGALALRGLSASYGTTEVLEGVNLTLPPRQCLAVVGESGSGKTTLARCIVGMHSNWSGEATFEGAALPRGVRSRPRKLLQSIQYIFQNPYGSLNPRKTIGQLVEQPLREFMSLTAPERASRVEAALEDVSLGSAYLDRYPDQLSGGERQRVAIARALVVEPRLLVCDEVTSALDVSVQATIVELLRRLQEEHHMGMLFITHNLALVRSIAQQVVVLANGRVVETGQVSDILDHPSEQYTQQLLADVPKLEDALAGMADRSAKLGDMP